MAKIRSSFAFALLCVNLIVTSVNVYFTVAEMRYLNNNPLRSNNLRGTKEKLLERNQNYFLEKEIEIPKNLRNLSPKAIKLSMLIINCVAFLFLIQLSVSFAITENECCTLCNGKCCIKCDDCCFLCGACCNNCKCCKNRNSNCKCDCNCNCNFNSMDCDCSGVGGDCGEGAIVLLVLFLVLIAIAIAVAIIIGLVYIIFGLKKHISRIIALVFLFAINAALVALSLFSGFDLNYILIASFSAFAAICNFFGLILPCCCEILTYEYASRSHIYPSNPINQPDEKLIETQPQFETPKKEETYYEKPYFEQNDPIPEQDSLELTNKPAAPDYMGQNEGSFNINGTSATNDTPSEEYQQTNNNDNNQENTPYPNP